MTKNIKKYIEYLWIIIIPFVAFLLGYTVGFEGGSKIDPSNTINYNGSIITNINSYSSGDIDMTTFWYTFNELQNKYFDWEALDTKDMIYGATKGLTSSLDDPYSVFLDPDETKDFNDGLKGNLEGIGCEISVTDGYLTVVSVLRDSPAEKAGLQYNDIIY